MITNDDTHEHHGDAEMMGIGRCQLEEGGVIEDCQLAVATFGELVDGAEVRGINDVVGHHGLFDVNPEFMPQVDAHLRDLFATPA